MKKYLFHNPYLIVRIQRIMKENKIYYLIINGCNDIYANNQTIMQKKNWTENGKSCILTVLK